MSQKTVSEKLFEKFCEQNAIPFKRICEGESRSPDYEIELGNQPIICEVKQIDPNREDCEQIEEREQGQMSAGWVPNRIRTKLKDVSRQLKHRTRGKLPGIVVIYNNIPIPKYGSSEQVLEAMFGQQTVLLESSRNSGASSRVRGVIFGGRRGVTPNHNTTVSAVAVLERRGDDLLAVRLYHNPHKVSDISLSPKLFAGLPIRQFAFKSEDFRTFSGWTELPPDI
jgi:hypothetical protein